MRLTNLVAALVVALAILLAALNPAAPSPQIVADGRGVPGSAEMSSPLSASVESAQVSPWAQLTGQKLAYVDAPGRDLVALTQRLKLHSGAPVDSVVNATPPNYPAGTRQQFNVADLVKKNYYTIQATIRYVTPHAYWYVKDGYQVDLTSLRASADWFESHIYPTDRRIFGPEPSPGIDNDTHITVLLTPLVGLNGYFSLSDSYPRVVNPFSNQREMIYIGNLPVGSPGDRRNGFEATLAHEFQHMIHWNVHRDRDVWLDEGCSEIAMYLNGYDPGSFDEIFENAPDTQLNAWASDPSMSLAHYGAAYLFLRYLMDHYGGEAFIKDLMMQPGLGVDAIDAVVKRAGDPAGFEGAYKDWLIANAANDPGVAGGQYSYTEGGQVAVHRTVQSYPSTRGDSVHQYGADYLKLEGDTGPLSVTFKGNSLARVIPVDPHSGQGYWYSNRRDSGDASMTRTFDLTGVRRATLQFWTWYDIEAGFDYAYVETSTDGGRNWETLKGRYTTTTNPNGQSFGYGWTGKSGVNSSSHSTARWVQESVDLSQYAGKRVQVRFEYVTDEGYNGPGFAVDDLRIPETGYSDNAETDNSWDARGFVRIGSTMPERWFVAVIEQGATTAVKEMRVDASGTGTLDLAGIGGRSPLRDVIVVVSPMAPKTTELASYTLTIKHK